MVECELWCEFAGKHGLGQWDTAAICQQGESRFGETGNNLTFTGNASSYISLILKEGSKYYCYVCILLQLEIRQRKYLVIQTELRDNTEHLNMLEENFNRASEDVVAYQVGKFESIYFQLIIGSIYKIQ